MKVYREARVNPLNSERLLHLQDQDVKTFFFRPHGEGSANSRLFATYPVSEFLTADGRLDFGPDMVLSKKMEVPTTI